MSEGRKDKAEVENQHSQGELCEASDSATDGVSWLDGVEYVIDEYWDQKFGFQFGVLDWRSVGAGC